MKESRRPLRFWASRTTAGSAGAMECLSSGGKRRRSAWWRSCMRLIRTAPPNARAGCRRRCMATNGCERLLPLPRGPGQHRPVKCFRATLEAIVAADSSPPQSTTHAWDRALRIFKRWLPAPRVLHPYSIVRFLATHPGGSRMRRSARTVLCRGRSVMVVPTASAPSNQVTIWHAV